MVPGRLRGIVQVLRARGIPDSAGQDPGRRAAYARLYVRRGTRSGLPNADRGGIAQGRRAVLVDLFQAALRADVGVLPRLLRDGVSRERHGRVSNPACQAQGRHASTRDYIAREEARLRVRERGSAAPLRLAGE